MMRFNPLAALPFSSPLGWFERSIALLAEGRAPLELAGLALGWSWLAALPTGDGHPVLVIPGLIGGEAASLPLRHFLADRDYAVYVWDQSFDLTAGEAAVARVGHRLGQIADLHGTGVSLIGLSFGGLLAREAAKQAPAKVRQVITLGTPSHALDSQTLDSQTLAPLAGSDLPQALATLIESLHDRIAKPPPVPLTSIYSRSDGIVNWRTCREPAGAFRENVEIFSSHLGFGHNPLALAVIADRLAQPEGGWRPYQGRLDLPFGLIAPVRDNG